MSKKGVKPDVFLFIFITIFSIFMVVYFFVNSQTQKNLINSSGTEDLIIINDTQVEGSSYTSEKISLPASVDSSQNYCYNFVVPKKERGYVQYIQFNLLYSSCILRCGDTVIFSNVNKDRHIVKSGGKSFNLIKIPYEYLDKSLEIEFMSNLPKENKMILPTIVIGAKAKILREAINQDTMIIVWALSLFITGFFLFLIAIFLRKSTNLNKTILVIALFSLIIAFYIYSKSWIVFYYLDNTVILYFIEHICLIVMPIPLLLLFIYSFYWNGYENWRVNVFENLTYLVFFNFIIQFILTISGISEFKEMYNFSQIVLVIVFAFVIISTVTIKKEDFKDKYHMLISIIPLFFAVCMVIYSYHKTHLVVYNKYTILAVMFFFLVHLYAGVINYVHVFNASIKKDFYEELAYWDILTSTKNRNAFKRMVEKLKNNELEYDSIYLMLVDMNNLKKINDVCGHNVGDEFLKKTGEILNKIEKNFKGVQTYRYGGDEFVLICLNCEDKDVKAIADEIKSKAKKYRNPKTQHSLSLAVGYDSIDKTSLKKQGLDLDKLFESADRNMYMDKIKCKEELIYEK